MGFPRYNISLIFPPFSFHPPLIFPDHHVFFPSHFLFNSSSYNANERLWHSLLRWPCTKWQLKRLGRSQCLQFMVGNGIPYLTEVSWYPYPFVSSGTFQNERALDKITRFTPNFVICGRVQTSMMAPTGQGIIKIARFSCESVLRVEIQLSGYL